ncbi:hypothetical protein RRG08_012172 [Elysia crispata]|uniref:Uncharacterized protein n=1 Tax=Elysia crispata TaxID=231223 RepID=A0AAE1DHX3_9GAST|nr:hypothetical protein RRG08_012172 [Elysia crispata]
MGYPKLIADILPQSPESSSTPSILKANYLLAALRSIAAHGGSNCSAPLGLPQTLLIIQEGRMKTSESGNRVELNLRKVSPQPKALAAYLATGQVDTPACYVPPHTYSIDAYLRNLARLLPICCVVHLPAGFDIGLFLSYDANLRSRGKRPFRTTTIIKRMMEQSPLYRSRAQSLSPSYATSVYTCPSWTKDRSGIHGVKPTVSRIWGLRLVLISSSSSSDHNKQ